MNISTRQSGVALLVAMMLLVSGSAFVLANGFQRTTKNNTDTLHSLLAAKQALIAYAVNYADNYGHNTRGGTGRLPCPALMRFSSPARSCQPGEIGFLPSVWDRNGRQMEIDYLERFLDRDIWYAVAADHRYNPAFNTLNSNLGGGLLAVDSLQEVVAVLIAPGAANQMQNRSGDANLFLSNVVSDYLEGENADGDQEFTLTEANDLLVPVRRSELLPLMERRVLGFAKQWLIEYKNENGYYPYAAVVGGNGECHRALLRGLLASEEGDCTEEPAMADVHFENLPTGRSLRQTWFHRYGWSSLIYYVVDETCAPARGVVDCDDINDPQRLLTVDGNQVKVVLISVGEPIESSLAGGLQVRSSIESASNNGSHGGLENYLDSIELLTLSSNYNIPPLSGRGNDQLVFIE